MRLLFLFIVLAIFSNLLLGQEPKARLTWVTGAVLNSDQRPVKKAVIYLDSTKTRIKTDKKGQFKIAMKPKNKVLSAYSWKYGIETVAWDGEDEVLIIFPESSAVVSQDELAAIGFKTKGKVKKKRQPKDYSKYLDMYQLIATEVPGALVSGTTIRLRGNALNSINSGQEPLIIVDEVVTSSLENIWPREVASVRVIRDESASLYGARGANGVIVIKMKK